MFGSAAPPVFDVAKTIQDPQQQFWNVCLRLTHAGQACGFDGGDARGLEPAVRGAMHGGDRVCCAVEGVGRLLPFP
ncbi:hypothetical protein [Streptomyces spinosirectus]